MKTKFMMLLAVMLLSVSAFAQSENNEPLKGDVNGDGKVDVADINEIIKIMKDAGGTSETPTYYWYVGTTKPTSVNGAVNNPATDKWTSLGTTKPSQILIESSEDYSFPNWYVAIPTSFNFQPYDMTGAELDLSGWANTIDTTTISGYSIWKLANNDSSFISMFK